MLFFAIFVLKSVVNFSMERCNFLQLILGM